MRKVAKLLSALFVLALCLSLAHFVLIPAFFKIKEPFFQTPIELKREVVDIEDLPVRNDSYGDGGFGAKRRGGRKHKGLDLAAKIKSNV